MEYFQKTMIVDKKFSVQYTVKYLETEKDAQRLEDGSWKLWVDEPWEMYKEIPCATFEIAVMRFLNSYGKYYDVSLSAEFCYEDKVVGREIIDCLPGLNEIAHNVAKTLYDEKYKTMQAELKQFEELRPLLSRGRQDIEDIIKFAKAKLEKSA